MRGSGLLAIKAYLLSLLVLATLNVFVEEVQAQNTRITNLRYPERAVLGTKSTAGGILVEFDVAYSGASSGYYIGFAIFDRNTDAYARGSATSTLQPCVQGTGTYAESAVCISKLTQNSGTAHATFYLRLFAGRYNLIASSILFDTNLNLIGASGTVINFQIVVTDKLTITVKVPSSVTITFDGRKQQAGTRLLFDVNPGTHAISVPELVQVDNMTRLRFQRWEDGSTQLDRTMLFEDDTTIEALYVTQYRLAIFSTGVNATGTGWYDKGSSATVSVPATNPIDGLLGLLGGKWNFQGWFEDERLLSPSSSFSLTMDRPHALVARWNADYTLPFGILAAVGIIVIGAALYWHRKRRVSASVTFPEHVSVSQATPAPEPIAASREVKYCRECGAQIGQDSVFCLHCGTRLS